MKILSRDNLRFAPQVASCKYLIASEKDQAAVEFAYLYWGERRAVCCSAQAGCALGCTHCATTYAPKPFIRNLTCAEILDAVRLIMADMGRDKALDYLDFSGIGDCSANWEAVRDACCESKRIGLTNAYLITTIAPQKWCRTVAEEMRNGTFAPGRIVISLHGPNHRIRRQTIPNAEDPWKAAAWWRELHGPDRRIDFNYVVHQKNTLPEHRQELARFVRANAAWVNELRLSRINPVEGVNLYTPETFPEFYTALRQEIPPTVRINQFTSVGRTVGMACGQMRASIQEKSTEKIRTTHTAAVAPLERKAELIVRAENSDPALGPTEYGHRFGRNPQNLRKVQQAFCDRAAYTEGWPILLHVEAAAACNLPCPLCPRGTGQIQRTGLLHREDFERVFTGLSHTLCNVIFSGWGEPLLNPEITQMIARVASYGIPVAMNTNGVLVEKYAADIVASGLNIVNISLDGAVSKATHAYPGKKLFDQVARGVRTLRRARADLNVWHPVIHGQFILDEETVDEIGALKTWAFQLGADHVKFKRRHETMPGEVHRNKQRTPHELRKIRAHDLVESTEKVDFSAKVCAHPWESIFLAATGDLSVCSWDPHQKINLGPWPDDFEALWNGKTMRRIRKWHSPESVSTGQPCCNCNRLPGYLRSDHTNREVAEVTWKRT